MTCKITIFFSYMQVRTRFFYVFCSVLDVFCSVHVLARSSFLCFQRPLREPDFVSFSARFYVEKLTLVNYSTKILQNDRKYSQNDKWYMKKKQYLCREF